MNRYKYIFIDAQILLTTGVYVVGDPKTGKIKKEDLLRMFLYSIFKIVREVPCDRPFLVWDSSPYHKNKILIDLLGVDDYKGDRGYKTAEDIDIIKKKISETTDKIEYLRSTDPIINDSQISELEEQVSHWLVEITNIERQIHNFQVRSETKYFIIDKLKDFGFTSIIKKGWECDDICTLLADYCGNSKERICLISKDSDYDFMLNEYTDKYNQLCKTKPTPENPTPQLTTYSMVLRRNPWVENFPDLKLFEAKAIFDSVYGSHNALHKVIKSTCIGKSLKEIIDNPEEYIEDIPRYRAQIETFNFKNYPDYDFISTCLPWYSKQGTLKSVAEFKNFLSENKIPIGTKQYEQFVGIVDYSLYN